jgi:hypothetical protein
MTGAPAAAQAPSNAPHTKLLLEAKTGCIATHGLPPAKPGQGFLSRMLGLLLLNVLI